MKFKRTQINDWNLKKEILVNLYNDFNLNRFRFTPLSNISHVEFLQKNVHYALLNYVGKPHLLYFKDFNGKKLCVLIERKTLDFKPKSIDDVTRKVQMSLLEQLNVKMDLYKGTLLDVKMVNNIFQVYNVFIWKGNDKTNESSYESFRILNDEKIDFINTVVIYNYSQLKQIKTIMESDSKVSGIIFIPKIPGNQIIFLRNQAPPTTNVINQPNTIYNKQTNEDIYFITQTDYPDAFFLTKESNGKDKKLAYLPGIKESEECRNWFKANPGSKQLLVKCIYKDNLDKWVPVKLVN